MIHALQMRDKRCSKGFDLMERWGDKRYYSLDYYVKQTFQEKLYKIALDGGMTCPIGMEHSETPAVFFAAPEDPGLCR